MRCVRPADGKIDDAREIEIRANATEVNRLVTQQRRIIQIGIWIRSRETALSIVTEVLLAKIAVCPAFKNPRLDLAFAACNVKGNGIIQSHVQSILLDLTKVTGRKHRHRQSIISEPGRAELVEKIVHESVVRLVLHSVR